MLGSRRRDLQRSCAARIAALDLPTPLQLPVLKQRLEKQRGREIWVLPDKGELPPEITGLWLGASTRDYVYFRQGLLGCRLDNTLLHEFAHMICKHRSANVAEQDWLRTRAPKLTAVGNIEHMCMRRDYASSDEQEAELMASLILARAEDRWQRLGHRSQQDRQTAARVESIFRT